jgi:hypothetical protein
MKKCIILFLLFGSLVGFGQVDLNNGLIANYPFSGNANDAGSLSNNGTVVGATLTTDRFGTANSAYFFDGNDYINVDNLINDLQGKNTYAITGWFQPSLVGGLSPRDVVGIIFAINREPSVGAGQNVLQVQITGTGDLYYQSDVGTYATNIGNQGIELDRWYFFYLVYNKNGTCSLFLSNAIETQRLTGPLDVNLTDRASIGQEYDGAATSQNWRGKIDDIRIYDRALTADELVALGPPVPPQAIIANANTSTSFSARWIPVAGASSYRLDATASTNFSTFLATYNGKSVTTTSDVVSGLTTGTDYRYRVRAVNGNGESLSSNVILNRAGSADPTTATAATVITATGFTANWNSVVGATGYRLDVSSDNFATLLTGYNNLAVSSTSQAVTGLNATTTYQYRVRATNAVGPSGNSNVISATTLQACPAIAVSITSSNKTNFTFAASGGQAPYVFSIDGSNFLPATNFTLTAGTYNVIARDANGCTGTTDFNINGVVDCGVTQASGGQGTTFTTHILGNGAGQVNINYQMFSIPDQMDVFYDNVLVASTNGLVSGSSTLSFNYVYNPSKPNFCVIRMTAPNSGTAWEYAAFCPAVPVPKISSFSPISGGVGTTVTITGINLAAATAVKFGTVSSPVLTNTGTTITVNVPSGAVSGPLLITNSFGIGESSDSFSVSPYCVSGATNIEDSRIDKVVFGSINNDTSDRCGTYNDYTNQVAFISPGQTLTATITAGTCGGNFNKIGKVFIDWNGDFDFDDAGEFIGASAVVNGTQEVTVPITAPANAVVGLTTRMRLVLEETSDPASVTACGTFAFGETEDYGISIIASGASTRSVAPVALPDFTAIVGIPSATRSFNISGVNLGTNSFTVTAPAQFQVANLAAGPFGSSVTVTPVSGVVGAAVLVRYAPAAAGTHTGNVAVSHPSFATVNVAVSGGSTVAAPSLTVFAAFDDFVTTSVGTPSPNQAFRVSGLALTANVTVTAPAQFQVSLDGTTFSSSVQAIPTNGSANQQLFARYNPSTTGPHTGNITIASAGITTVNLPVSGGSLSVPTGLQARFVANTGFDLSWDGIPLVKDYRLDVSTSSTFATFVTGWQNALVNFSNPIIGRAGWSVLGLAPSTVYYLRLRAVYPTGVSGNSDVLTVSTTAHPAMVSPNVWVNTFGSSGNETFVNGLATDPEGNVYAVGKFGGSITLGSTVLTSQGSADIYFAKYNSAGVVQWAKSIGGVGVDEGWQIAVEAGAVYISGVFDETVDFDPNAGVTLVSTRGASNNPQLTNLDDGFVARYNASDGAFVWAKSLGDAWPQFQTRALAAYTTPGDGSTSVFITGMFTGTNDFDPGAGTTNLTAQGGPDIFVARYDGANGNFAWANRMGSSNWDSGTAVLVDGGSLYATGWFYGDIDLDPGAGTINVAGRGTYLNRFSGATGALTYAKSFTSTGYIEGYDLARDITHVYLVGGMAGSADLDPDAGANVLSIRGGFVAKYLLTNGSLAWANGLNSNDYMSPTRVIADQTGVYVGGNFAWLADFDPGPGEANRTGLWGDVFVARYNSANGAFQWAKNIGGGGFDQMRGSMALANDGLYVGGFFAGTVNFDPYTNVLNRTATGVSGGFIAKYQTVSPPAPTAPVLLPASFVSNRGFLARWNGVADVNSYRIDVASDNSFVNRVFDNTEARVTPTTAVIEFDYFGLAPSTTYFVRIRAQAAGGLLSANSNVISFTTDPNPIEQSNNLWASTFGSAGSEQTTAVTTDASGNVYGVGYFGGSITIGSTNLSNAGGQDAFFAKYNSSGVVQWAKSLGSAQNEEIWAVATDATGVYVYGFFTAPGLDVDPNSGVTTLSGTGITENAFLAKYSLVDGSLIWAVPLGDVSVITGSPLISDGTNI